MHLPIHQVGPEILVDGARVEALAGQALQDGARVAARDGLKLERVGARVEDMAAERVGHLEVSYALEYFLVFKIFDTYMILIGYGGGSGWSTGGSVGGHSGGWGNGGSSGWKSW